VGLNADRAGTSTLNTYYGPQSLHELFERTTCTAASMCANG